VAVLHHRDVGLIAAHRRDDVAGVRHQSQPLGVPEGAHGFVEAAVLRERDARKRVHQREMTQVAGRVQRGRRLRDVIADDRAVADLAVAEPELIVGETDGAGIVRAFSLFQRAGEEGDASGRLAPCDRELAVQPPQLRQAGRVQPLAFRWMAERLGGLPEVVLEQPRFRQRTAELERLVTAEAWRLQNANEQRRGVCSMTLLKGVCRLSKEIGRQGVDSIPRIQSS